MIQPCGGRIQKGFDLGIYARFKQRLDDILFLRANSEPVDIGILNKIRMWSRGFVSEAYLLHSFGENDPGDYVSDLVRLKKACRINGYFSIVLMDKLYLAKMLSDYSEHLPEIYGVIRGGRWHRLGRDGDERIEALAEFCMAKGAAAIKPIVGMRGQGVRIVRRERDRLIVNREVLCRAEFVSCVSGLDGYLATEFVEQHPYAASIYTHATNTVRILTLWDDEAEGPFVAAAVHRFGTFRSAPIDNWTAGGLSAMVDVDTGRIGKAVSYPAAGYTQTFKKHPETDGQIEGACVARWDEVKDRVLTMARGLAFVPYIGWDIVVTADGFKVIEGNNCPGINLIQVHFPLLKDARIRRFYERRLAMLNGNGALKRNYKLPIRI